jgi:hypothetical protein
MGALLNRVEEGRATTTGYAAHSFDEPYKHAQVDSVQVTFQQKMHYSNKAEYVLLRTTNYISQKCSLSYLAIKNLQLPILDLISRVEIQ